MKTLQLPDHLSGEFNIPTSKSYSNRALILQALHPKLKILDLSTAKDTAILQSILLSTAPHHHVGHAGTAMRFATAFFAHQPHSTTILTGSDRMNERPIGALVDALRSLGAVISFENQTGYPPLKIEGRALQGGKIAINASISSQYITALLLLGTALPKGIQIALEGKIVSKPYLEMTINMIRLLGGRAESHGNVLKINYLNLNEVTTLKVPGDWSSAAYAFAHVAASKAARIFIPNLQAPNDQADGIAVQVFKPLGVGSVKMGNGYTLHKEKVVWQSGSLDCTDFPDLVPAVAAVVGFHGKHIHLTGLETLRVKETDRIAALQAELANFGIATSATEDTLTLHPSATQAPLRAIKTYQDHRMAMAFSIFAHRYPITVEQPEVVEKSFPNFWNSLRNLITGI